MGLNASRNHGTSLDWLTSAISSTIVLAKGLLDDVLFEQGGSLLTRT